MVNYEKLYSVTNEENVASMNSVYYEYISMELVDITTD